MSNKSSTIITKKYKWITLLVILLVVAVSGILISVFILIKPMTHRYVLDFSAYPNNDFPIESQQNWTVYQGRPGYASRFIIQEIHTIGNSLSPSSENHVNMLACYGDGEIDYTFSNPTNTINASWMRFKVWAVISSGYFSIGILGKGFDMMQTVHFDVRKKPLGDPSTNVMLSSNFRVGETRFDFIKNILPNALVDFTIFFINNTHYTIRYTNLETLQEIESEALHLDPTFYGTHASINGFYIISNDLKNEPVAYLESVETSWNAFD